LRAYLQRAPGARPHVPVNKDAPVAEFQKVAAEFPVFRITSSNTVATQPGNWSTALPPRRWAIPQPRHSCRPVWPHCPC